MASVSGANSTTNSFFNTYGNANAVTGLASGMDTEGMIEQAVSGFQKKIESLQQRQTLLQWKQVEMRGMISMLYNLNQSYASYTSKTNLYSPSFFTSAKTYSLLGANADKIAVSGGSSNNSITINSVKKLATAATYRVSAGDVFGGTDGTGEKIKWDDDFDLAGEAENGLIAVTLDGASKFIRISDLGDPKDIDTTEKLAKALQTQIDKAFGEGRVKVEEKDGALSFSADGSTLEVQSNVVELGLGSGVMNYVDTVNTKAAYALCKCDGNGTYTYNGTAYTEVDGRLVDENGTALALEINGARIEISANDSISDLISKINNSRAGVTASYSQLTNQFTFTAKETGAGGKIEFGGPLGSAFQKSNAPKDVNAASLFGDIQWDEKGEAQIEIDDTEIITLKQTDSVEDLIKKIDELDRYNGLIRYDSASGTYGLYGVGDIPLEETDGSFFVIGSDITLKITDLVGTLNGIKPDFTPGQDAELTVTVDGVEKTLTRASNTFDLDGLSVTIKDTFEDGPVTFKSQVDTEKIVSAVKSFIEDYNAIIKAVRAAYTTQPLEKSSSTHAKYEPLTDSDKEGLSEKAIADYEEKAKTGMFYMDSDLSSLYSELRGILMANKDALAEIGISVEYDKDGRSNYLELDEEKLASVLEGDIDKVVSLFTDQDGEPGLMSSVQSTVKKYASTSIGDYGILVRKAGAAESAISQRAENNAYQKELERLEDQIDKLKSRLSTKVDYYSRQFSMLEQLMGTYNNQSSMLMSMMGY